MSGSPDFIGLRADRQTSPGFERIARSASLRELDPPACRFEGAGDSVVGRGKTGLRYDPTAERVYINAAQYFGPVPPDVWAYQVGEKWLKDRCERRLALDDIRTYCRIVTALGITLAIQAEIDAVYAAVERATVSF